MSMATDPVHDVETEAPSEKLEKLRLKGPLHRLGEVRRQQGVSLRRVARTMKKNLRQVRFEEQNTTDVSLSTLYKWQKVLDVPIADLLIEPGSPLSPLVLQRARMVKLMKSATAILENCRNQAVRRMAQTLVDQLVELMPELEGVSPWHAVGQRRTLGEYGVAAQRRLPDQLFQ